MNWTWINGKSPKSLSTISLRPYIKIYRESVTLWWMTSLVTTEIAKFFAVEIVYGLHVSINP